MNLSGLLGDVLSGGTVSQISQAIGTDEDTASSAIQAALPMLVGGLARNAQSESGLGALAGALDRDHDGSGLNDIAGLVMSGGGGAGAGILGHIFGGGQGNVAQSVSQASGLDLGKVAPLLMILAPIVMGAVGKAHREQGSSTSGLADLLGGAAASMGGGSSSSLMGILSSVLDRNHDGSALDDVAGMLGGLFGGRR